MSSFKPPQFNPLLLARTKPHHPCKLVQRNLIIAFLPYLGVPSTIEQFTAQLIVAGLEFFAPLIGPWRLVWGPGVYKSALELTSSNTMFVAEQQDTKELFIGVAGTNPFSAYAWFVEDFQVSETRPWIYGSAPECAAISKGTLRGLLAQQTMVPPDGVPGANLSLQRFLTERFAEKGDPVELTVSGHSLGGALSPAVGLWLLDTRDEWDPHKRATISVYAYAGPPPGNAAFADYAHARFEGRLHRIANSLDPVVHAWHIPEIVDLKVLYTPFLSRDRFWDKAVDFAVGATNGIDYRQLDPNALILDGKLYTELEWRWAPKLVPWIMQAIFQHTVAYFELLGLEYPERHRGLVEHLVAQVGRFAEAIVQRIEGPPMLDPVLHTHFVVHAVAEVLRLFAQAYAHLEFTKDLLPSDEASHERAAHAAPLPE